MGVCFFATRKWTRIIQSDSPVDCRSPPAGWRRNITICQRQIATSPFRCTRPPGGRDSNDVNTARMSAADGLTEANHTFAQGANVTSPFAVPEKIFGLTLVLDFFDRCTHCALAASATGSARARGPSGVRREAAQNLPVYICEANRPFRCMPGIVGQKERILRLATLAQNDTEVLAALGLAAVCGARKNPRAYADPRFFRPLHTLRPRCICHRQRSGSRPFRCTFAKQIVPSGVPAAKLHKERIATPVCALVRNDSVQGCQKTLATNRILCYNGSRRKLLLPFFVISSNLME